MRLLRLVSCLLIVSICLLAGGTAGAKQGRTHVYLLRGIFNVSVGLDALAVKLARMGMSCTVYGHGDAFAVAAQAARDYRSGKARSLILIGHSLGAGAAVMVAEQLKEAGVPITLLITLDPVGTFAVPRNVRRAVNFYVSSSGRSLAAAADFRGALRNVDMKDIEGMDHMTIQSMDLMHRRMIGEIAGGSTREPRRRR